jgi:hypothetical protein
MKKSIFVFAFLLLCFNKSKADQLLYLSRAQADSTIKLLEKQEKIIVWCACCQNDPKTILSFCTIKLGNRGNGYYGVVITGIDPTGKSVERELDLAYTHIKIKGKWNSVGSYLKYNCDPCTTPFTF